MTTVEKKDQVATWNGDPTTWLEYVKRVRLQYERTEVKKRHLLGAELASRLTGRAWDIVSSEVDHGQLQRKDGPAYLLHFLEDRLCKAPVPDTGQRLEDFFLRLRRTPGSSMAEWATQVRESYRRLQRAMARQRKDLERRQSPTTRTTGRPASDAPGSERLRSDVTSPRANRTPPGSPHPPDNPGHEAHEEPADPRPGGYEPVPQRDPDNESSRNGEWTAEEWSEWYHRRRRRDWDDEDAWWDEEPIQWDQFDFSTEEILPKEILGWILLRRSGLPASARLSVLSATNNRLDLDSMERAMRDQEEELLAAESQRIRGDHLHRARRSYWVEQDAQWGCLPDGEVEELDESSILWVGDRLPPDVYAAHGPEEAWSTFLPDGHEMAWEWCEDDFYAPDAAGIYWSWADTKTWLDVQESGEAEKPLQEAFVAFQDRLRSFKESRALNAAKHVSRGFYPLKTLKGKFKGSPKGKGKGKSFGKSLPSSPTLASSTVLAAFGKGGSGQRPGNPEYKGCFVCGAQDHDWRRCPKRSSSSVSMAASTTPSSYYAHEVYMVTTVDSPTCDATTTGDDEGDSVVAALGPDVLAAMSVEFPGHAVIDSGATESIASMEALEEIMTLRARRHGPEEFVVRDRQKKFRFGNGTYQSAVSFVEVPQIVNGQRVPLGVHALDAPGIPLLISVKTLKRMKAIVDFERDQIQFQHIAPGMWIPLSRAPNGHLLLDLTQDWVPQGEGANSFTAMSAEPALNAPQFEQYMKGPAQSEYGKGEASCAPCKSAPVSVEPMLSENQEHTHSLGRTDHHVHVHEEMCDRDNSGSSMRAAWPLVIAAVSTAFSPTSSPSSVPDHGGDFPHRRHSCSGDLSFNGNGGGKERAQAEEQAEEGPGSNARTLRFLEAGGPRPEGWTQPGVPMLWESHSHARRPRLSIGPKCPRQVDCLRHLSSSSGIYPGLWSQGNLPTGGSSGSRRQDGDGPGEGRCGDQPSEPREAEREDGQCLGSRGVVAEPPGSVGEREGQGPDQDSASAKGNPGGVISSCALDRNGRADEECAGQESAKEGERQGGRASRVARLGPGRQEEFPLMVALTELHTPDVKATEEILTQPYAILTTAHKAKLEDYGVKHLADINDAFEEIMVTAPQVDLMEVCCPIDSTLVEVFHEHGRSALRVGLPACDLSTQRGCVELAQMVSRHRPRLLWFSLPCGSYEPSQKASYERTDEMLKKSQQRQRKSRKMMKHAIEIAYQQLEGGREIAWEWPSSNGGWQVREMRSFMDYLRHHHRLHVGRVHGCSYGLKNSSNEFLKKQWKIVCSNEALAAGISRQCPGDHSHGECLEEKETRASGFYPTSMCTRVFQVTMAMAQGTLENAFPQVFPVFHEKEILEEPEEKTKSFVPLTQVEKKNVEKSLHKLHRRTGHPSNQALASCLRHRGAHPEVVTMAKQHQCPECQELRLATSNPSASLQRSETLWETLVIDNAEFPVDDQVIHCMVMVDEASRLICPHLLFQHPKQDSRNCTGSEAIQALQDTWIRHYGAPAAIRLDPEGAFRATELSNWAAERGIEILPCETVYPNHQEQGETAAAVRGV